MFALSAGRQLFHARRRSPEPWAPAPAQVEQQTQRLLRRPGWDRELSPLPKWARKGLREGVITVRVSAGSNSPPHSPQPDAPAAAAAPAQPASHAAAALQGSADQPQSQARQPAGAPRQHRQALHTQTAKTQLAFPEPPLPQNLQLLDGPEDLDCIFEDLDMEQPVPGASPHERMAEHVAAGETSPAQVRSITVQCIHTP